MATRLIIYIERGCESCQPAISIAEEVQRQAPDVQVDLIDLAEEPHQRPDSVFAVPTYVLDGRILSLGNPRLDDLLETLNQQAGIPSGEVTNDGERQI
jgi:hypothetical protein